MGKFMKPDKINAKDFILSKRGGSKLRESEICLLNAMDRYDLELLCLRAMSILFSDIAESSLVRTSAFLGLLQKNLVFMYEVSLPRRASSLEFNKPDESLMSEARSGEEYYEGEAWNLDQEIPLGSQRCAKLFVLHRRA